MDWYKKLTWRIKPISDKGELQSRVSQLGFLPMFRCGIRGYSVYEATPHFWTDDEDGPWEWKGPIIREGECAYGKFFNRRQYVAASSSKASGSISHSPGFSTDI